MTNSRISPETINAAFRDAPQSWKLSLRGATLIGGLVVGAAFWGSVIAFGIAPAFRAVTSHLG